jgi:quinol monooxygenase YgiN
VGRCVIACFRPKTGREEELLAVVRDHMPTLRAENLITEREAVVMRASDGTIVEVFEWLSRDAIARAHENPRVLALWERYEAVCEYVTLVELPEGEEYFPDFEPVDV